MSSDPAPMDATPSHTADAYAADGFGAGAPGGQPAAAGQGQRVTLMDHGLQMPRGAQHVPAGWTLTQDLATDPVSGQPLRDVLDIRGPRGELARGVGVSKYAAMMGMPFEQAWRQLTAQRLQGEFSDVSFGAVRPSAALGQSRAFQRVLQRFGGGPMRIEALEAPLRARRDGRPVEGVVYLANFGSPQGETGAVQATVVLSPPDRLQETLRAHLAMADSYEPNPAYEQRIAQINQGVAQRQQAESQQRMAASQALHQQRMAANQARFDAHQQMMQGRYAAADQQHQSWQASQRSSDEMQRRTVNGIHSTVDVYNNQTGETTYGVQGGYDAYWTDPSGNVVGTQGYDNPDPLRFEQGTDLDDRYDQEDR